MRTPHIARESLYKKSGHLPYYAESMFPPMEASRRTELAKHAMPIKRKLIAELPDRSHRKTDHRLMPSAEVSCEAAASRLERTADRYYLKAMNCPHHHKLFAAVPRSYRDLPLRLAEYGTCYRYEQSGELFGLMRVRSMQMNDAHHLLHAGAVRDRSSTP